MHPMLSRDENDSLYSTDPTPKLIYLEFLNVGAKMSIVCKDPQMTTLWSKVWESCHRQDFPGSCHRSSGYFLL